MQLFYFKLYKHFMISFPIWSSIRYLFFEVKEKSYMQSFWKSNFNPGSLQQQAAVPGVSGHGNGSTRCRCWQCQQAGAVLALCKAWGSCPTHKHFTCSKPDCSAKLLHCPSELCLLLPKEVSACSCWLAQSTFVKGQQVARLTPRSWRSLPAAQEGKCFHIASSPAWQQVLL